MKVQTKNFQEEKEIEAAIELYISDSSHDIYSFNKGKSKLKIKITLEKGDIALFEKEYLSVKYYFCFMGLS